MKFEGNENWVPIFEAATVEEATMLMGMLEAARIPVVLDRDGAGDASGFASGVMNEVAIKVPKEMVSKATNLLHQSKSVSFEY